MKHLAPFVFSLALASAVSAQSAEPPTPTAFPGRVPIHTNPADPTGGEYGLWALGPGYKVSFHDSFAFYPYVPGQAKPRALRWRTESIDVGALRLPASEPRLAHGEYRCTMTHGAFVEAYDVREDGVEQTFVIPERPLADGDLVVVGRVTSEFRAEPRTAGVGALRFVDEHGVVVLEYGKALAFDAKGEKVDVATSYDGECVRLHVPREFVARATFPLTVDPLTAVKIVNLNSSGPVRGTSIAATSAAGDTDCFVAVVREFASTDFDVIGYRMNNAGTVLQTLFTDVTTSWSTTKADVTESSLYQRWALAIQRDFSSPASSGVRVYLHFMPNTATNSGNLLSVAAGTDPRIGGHFPLSFGLTTSFLVVFLQKSATGRVVPLGAIVDSIGTVGTPVPLQGTFPVFGDAFDPTVVKYTGGSGAYRVAWAEQSTTTDRQVRVAVVSGVGTVMTVRNMDVSTNAREPRIAGSGDRYLMTWLVTAADGNSQLRARRFDMATTGGVSYLQDRVLATAQTAFGQRLRNGELAYDIETRSHWVASYERYTAILPSSTSVTLVRMGYTGGVVEAASLHPSTSEGVANTSVAYDGWSNGTAGTAGFVVSFSTTTPSQPAYFRRFEYAHGTGAFYGTSCRANTYADGHPPYAGSEFYYTGVHGLVPNSQAVALVGLAPLDIPLDSIGMTGCRLLVDSVVNFPAVADATGFARFYLPLRDAPVFQGDIFVQWVWFDPTANPLGVVTAGGLRIDVE